MILHKIPRGCAYLQHIDRVFQSSHAPLCASGDLRSKKANRSVITRTCFTTSTNIKMIWHKIPRGCAYLQHIDRAFQSSHAPLCAPGDLGRKKANRNTITCMCVLPHRSTNIKMILHRIPRGCAHLQHIDRAFQSSHAPLCAPGDLGRKKSKS